MEIFRISDFLKKPNPNGDKRFMQEILTKDKGMQDVGGIFTITPPGGQTPFHFHKKRESIIIVIGGEGTELIEDKKIPIKTNDVLCIPPGEKHGTVNNGKSELRCLEFFTCPPVTADFVEVK